VLAVDRVVAATGSKLFPGQIVADIGRTMALAIQRFEALTAGEGNLSPNDTVAFTLTTGRRVPVI
jgi:hypothetical protein